MAFVLLCLIIFILAAVILWIFMFDEDIGLY